MQAHQLGISALSITDHDTVGGIQEAYSQARVNQVLFISGVEISASCKEKAVHILGYGFDPCNESFESFLAHQQQARQHRNEQMLDKLASYKLKLEKSIILDQKGVVGRVHIAKELLRQGYVQTLQEAFHKWIGDSACCFVHGIKPSVGDCIRALHAAGGRAFLAHPHLMDKAFAFKVIKEHALDGLEAYYGRFNKNFQKFWLELACKKGLLISGGSDFHGSIKPEGYLGSSFIDELAFRAIVEGTYWESML